MRTYCVYRRLVVAGVAVLLLQMVQRSSAQGLCPGDLNGDGSIHEADLSALVPVLFGEPEGVGINSAAADVNRDNAASAADIVAIIRMQGTVCTSTPAASGTPTVTRTPTATFTRPPTPTPTEVCTVQVAQFGTTNGALTTSDCRRAIGASVSYVDEYTISGTPGTAIKVVVVGTAPATPIVPVVEVIDPGGQFGHLTTVGSANGATTEFTVSTSQPYTILVGAAPSGPNLGPYQLTLTSRPCPPPTAIASFPANRSGTLDGTECPDPASPSEPADIYTFTVSTVPTNLSITMRQSNVDDDISPALTILGPDNFELASNTDDTGVGANYLLQVQVRFLALQAGTYTIIATGQGGTGRYTLSVTSPTCSPKALTNIPPDRPLICPGSSGGCPGTLSGNTSVTSCAAPLPAPGGYDNMELNAPANLYTFEASAGDVISVEMQSDDDAHLYLLGPASAGNPLIAEDDDGAPKGGGDSLLATTLAVAGTYTIVAANNNFLFPPDPPDPADVVNYVLFVQKCPSRQMLDPSTGQTLTQSFTVADCFGSGGIPVASYLLSGTAGQFVTAAVSSDNFDPFVRLLAPDSSTLASDNDLFDSTPTARVNRILPAGGTYFVEASAAPDTVVAVTSSPPPAFTVQAQTCATTPAATGTITGTFTATDCSLPDGRRFDVFSFPGVDPAAPRFATISPPANGCVVGLMAEGPQVPAADACSSGLTEFAVLGHGTYGFVVASRDAAPPPRCRTRRVSACVRR